MTNSIKAVVVDPEGRVELEEIIPELATFQGLVGGFIESISGDGWTAYLNETGKLAGLSANPTAYAIAHQLGWRYLPGDHLVGTVVFCGPADEDGNDTSITDRVLSICRSHRWDTP